MFPKFIKILGFIFLIWAYLGFSAALLIVGHGYIGLYIGLCIPPIILLILRLNRTRSGSGTPSKAGLIFKNIVSVIFVVAGLYALWLLVLLILSPIISRHDNSGDACSKDGQCYCANFVGGRFIPAHFANGDLIPEAVQSKCIDEKCEQCVYK